MQQDSENDFIRRKYRWHLLWLFLTLSIIALILGLDIEEKSKEPLFNLNTNNINCVIIQLDPKQLIYTILEIIFCLLIFVLTCMELRYFYRIKQNNFSFTYSSIISQKCLKVIIFCLGIIFFTNVIIVLIYIAFEIMNIESLNSCHYFSLTNKITKLIISIIIIFGYLIMILIPLKIRKTLILLSNQKQNLVQDIFLNDNEGDFLDITPNDGNFCIIKTQKPQNVLYLPSSELKKFICKICISKIKNNQNIVKISCSHIFHEQCFNKYALSIMKQQSFILTCKVCDEGVNIDKQEFYVQQIIYYFNCVYYINRISEVIIYLIQIEHCSILQKVLLKSNTFILFELQKVLLNQCNKRVKKQNCQEELNYKFYILFIKSLRNQAECYNLCRTLRQEKLQRMLLEVVISRQLLFLMCLLLTIHLYSQQLILYFYFIFYLYTCEEGKHKFHQCKVEGILVFLIDRREGKAFYLRILQPISLEVRFSVELYFGFIDSWSPVRGFNNFYAFPFGKGFIGMLFVNEQEAQRVTQKIKQYAPSKKDLEKLNMQIKEDERLLKAYKQQQKEKDSFSYQFKAFFGKEKVEKPIQIGTPQNVKRNTLSLNVETGEIDVDKLPPALVEVFLNAGITKKDLQDKQKAKEIFKTVAKFGEKNQLHAQIQSNQQNTNQSKKQSQVITQPSQIQNPIQAQQQNKTQTVSIVSIIQFYKFNNSKQNYKFLINYLLTLQFFNLINFQSRYQHKYIAQPPQIANFKLNLQKRSVLKQDLQFAKVFSIQKNQTNIN